VILPGLLLRRLTGGRPNPSHEGIKHYPKGGDVTSGIHSSSQTLTVNPSQRAQLRAGVVGIGKQAIEDHIPGLLASDGAKLVAICDDDRKSSANSSTGSGYPATPTSARCSRPST
jgi:hypothetical protein